MQLKIIDDEGREPPGWEIGEIALKNTRLMKHFAGQCSLAERPMGEGGDAILRPGLGG